MPGHRKPPPPPSPEDVHPGIHSPPPPKKRKRPPSPEDHRHETPNHRPPPKSPPKAPPPPSPEDNRHDTPNHRPPAPPAWVISRQRRLRLAGYPVRVDGVWGPRSQHFWSQFQAGRRPSIHIPDMAGDVRRSFASAERRQEDIVRRLRGVQSEIQAGVSSRLRVERALRASHVSLALPDGRASGGTRGAEARRETQIAVARERRQAKVAAERARGKSPEQMSLDDVVALTVDPLTGHFDPRRPGDVKRVQLWLKAHGHKGLETDGVFGQQTFAALRDSYFAAKQREEHDARSRLTSVLYDSHVLKPGSYVPGIGKVAGPGELLRELGRGGFGASVAWARLVELARDRGLEYQTWKEQQLRSLDRSLFGAVTPPDFLTSDLDRYLRISASPVVSPAAQAQLRALTSSTSFPQLRRTIHQLKAQEEALRKHDLEAAKHREWWQGALDYTIVKPGEWTRSEIFKTGTAIYAVTTRGLEHAGDRGTLEEQAAGAQEWLIRNHPWINLAFVLAIDPINLVPGAGTIGRAGTAGALRLERLGYAVAASGEFTRLTALRPVLRTGLGLTLPVQAGRDARAGTRFLVDTLGQTQSGQALRHVAALSTRMKSEAIATSRLGVTAAMRHGFRKPELAEGLDSIPEFKHDGEFRRQLDDALARVAGQVERSFPKLLGAFGEARISLFVTADRRELSGVGAALLARVAEVFRVNEVRRLALERANDAFVRVSPDGTVNAAAAETAARAAYRDVVVRAGSYIRGAHDPELQRVLLPRVQRSADRFEHVIFRQMQDTLEARLEAAGESLFDSSGRWAERHGLAANELRRLGADAFDPERAVSLPNQAFGQVFTLAERNDLIEDEVSSEVGRAKSWFYREAAAGRPRSKDWLDHKIDTIQTEAEAAWRPSGGGWIDTREFRSVPDIYARQATALYGLAARGGDPLLLPADVPAGALEALAQLSAAPVDALDGAVEAELERLAWSLAGGTGKGTFSFGGRFDAMLGRYAPQDFGAADGQALRDVVDEAAGLLSRGFDEALPQALRREWAMFEALAEAQGFWARNSYRAISGALSVWIFATLPLRPGWGVRNIIDNTAKNLIRGARNPLVYGGPDLAAGSAFRSVFENDLRMIREVAAKFDGLFGTDVSARFQQLVDTVWEHETAVLSRIFRAHDIPVPEVVLDGARFNPFEEFGQRAPRPFKSEKTRPDPGLLARFRDNVWELMASRPENYSKRMLYRTTYARELERTGDEVLAHEAAWRDVEETLFDYSKVSVLEDNLRPLFPFVQFWRKNTRFWIGTAFDKPWLPAALYRYETQVKEGVHADLPGWMRRYIHTDEIGDGLGKVPGLAWLGRAVMDADVMADPLNLFSFAPLYRAFKDDSPLLPADRAGLPFISGLIDGLNDWGLSMNPILRKGLELTGVANYRSWQSVFPQTALVEAFTRRFWHDRFPNGLNVEAMLEDPIAERLIGQSASELIAANFNEWVQLEMANQRLRGERVSRPAAERKIQDYFLLQTVVGYFVGIYARRMSPQDFWLYQMQDQLVKRQADFLELSPREQDAYRLYKLRKVDAVEFDRYVSLIPLIQGYYRQGSYKAKERFKLDHPEVLPFVEPVWAGKGIVTDSVVQTAALVENTDFVMRMLDLASDLRLPFEVREAGQAVLVTPELKQFWARNDTPAETRDKHLKLLFFRYVEKLNETFFAIPADDHEAKRGFLEQHPVLVHWWQQNNSDADDYKAIINSANSALRELFFEKVEADGWDSANDFLHQYPFIFEFTKASKKVNPITGDWLGFGGSGGRSQHARDYLAAKASLDEFFALPQAQRSAWLQGGSEAAQIVRSYFARYSHGGHGRSQHASDFLAARPYLEQFFKVLKSRGEDEAWLWLNGQANTRAASIVKSYFKKYAHPNGTSQHAADFLKAKGALDHYFKLGKGERSDWLHGGSKDAEVVLAYFKKWGSVARVERVFKKRGLLSSSRPELNRRLLFWSRYFQLDPDDRPSFIIEHAEEYGVFVYGPEGADRLARREAEYLRAALALGAGDKAAMQVYVRPLLDYFFTLKGRDEKQLFLRANPELDFYFRHFVRSSPTGSAKLDRLVEGYFALPEHSLARSAYLREHPDVQDFFDKRSTPADRAMRNLLEVYFVFKGQARKDFLLRHPEIQAYFDKRADERRAAQGIGEAFLRADPRLAEFWALARVDITLPGQAVADHLHHRGQHSRSLAVRRERSYA